MGQCSDKLPTEETIRLMLMNETLVYVGNSSNESQYNFPMEVWFDIIRERQLDDRNLSGTTEKILIVLYGFLIVTGLITNLLVSFVIARRRQMHTARNLYIVNLTISDISLCFICMPFTLVMILRRNWTLGSVLCKLVNVLQGTNVFVSVGTITVIALDRYFTICRRTTQDVSSTRRRVVVSIALIWLLSLLASMPGFFYQGIQPVTLSNIVLYEVCIEDWPSQELKVAYSSAVLLIMAVIPPVVVATVHARIATYLHTHTKTQKNSARARREIERNRRTTLLLSGIVIIFAVSWLPLGLFAFTADLIEFSPHVMYTSLAIVHIFAMSSAISNPIVYGWLNSNIRREFLALMPQSCAQRFQKKTKDCNKILENETNATNVNFYTTTTAERGRLESVALLDGLPKLNESTPSNKSCKDAPNKESIALLVSVNNGANENKDSESQKLTSL